VIELVACVCPLTGLSMHEVLWSVPAAVTYQFFLVWLQIQGRDIRVDRSAVIYRQLTSSEHKTYG
jgi:hypothetical protein